MEQGSLKIFSIPTNGEDPCATVYIHFIITTAQHMKYWVFIKEKQGCSSVVKKVPSWDMNYGKEGERPAADENIGIVPDPKTDPVYGSKSHLLELWGS